MRQTEIMQFLKKHVQNIVKKSDPFYTVKAIRKIHNPFENPIMQLSCMVQQIS